MIKKTHENLPINVHRLFWMRNPWELLRTFWDALLLLKLSLIALSLETSKATGVR